MAVLLSLCFLGTDFAGLFDTLDNRVSELRFASRTRAPTGEVVVVDIDARSIGEIGVWPWPRSLYADLLAAAAKAGARRVAFDIDFSSASTQAEDEAFATALANTGIETYLAAFAQPETSGTSVLRKTLPLPSLLQASWPVGVDLPLDPDGRVRRAPHASDWAGETLASMPSVLANRDGETGLFGIDFATDAAAIPRVSFVDLLGGRIGPGALAGRSLIVGASAIELHDVVAVPVFGTVAGSTVLALAAETLLQDRAMTKWSPSTAALALAGLAGLCLVARLRPRHAVGVLALVMFGVEVAALVLQQHGAVEAATGRLQGIGAALLAWTLLRAIDIGRLRLWIARIQAANSQSMLERVVDASFDGIVIVDGEGDIARVNGEAVLLLGVPATVLRRAEDLPEPLRQEVLALVRTGAGPAAPVDRTRRQMQVAVGGAGRVLEYSIAPFGMTDVSDDAPAAASDRLHLCLTLRDVTERERAEDRLRHLALHDGLTGLGNRRSLESAIDEAAADRRPDGRALLAFDLDRFKAVNDALGHATGDAVLVETARRACAAFGEAALVFRIGGDEFAVLLPCGDGSDAEAAARRFLGSVREPYLVRGHRISVASSVGICRWTGEAPTLAEMMRRADIALYRAKSRSGERIVVFESGMEVDRLERLALEREIERALDEGEFEVVYQPQVMLETAEIIGAEALVRWRHPVRGSVAPSVFVPIAEEMGHIHRLGAFVLETACREAARWPGHLKVAVNVSALQFEAGDIVSAVRRALSLSGLPARQLELELTESAFVAETGSLNEAFEALTALGVGFALDDYGTGYSALGYLHRFPISKIKIDRSFVVQLTSSRQSVAILRSIVALGEGLEIRTIAEGIETLEQAVALQALGCREGQGYLYSKPVGAAAFRCLVDGLSRPVESPLRAVS